jgi:hypothetical protein
MQTLEPGLAARFGDQWAEITGTATQDQHKAVTVRLAERGHVASTAAKGELRTDRLAAIGQKLYGDDTAARAQPALPPAGPPATAAPAASPALPQMAPGGPADDPRDVLPAADRAKLWRLLTDTPGGISTRRADHGGLLRRVDPLPGNDTWSREWTGKQLQIWEDAAKVRVIGRGREQRWVPVLRVVTDADRATPQPQTSVREPDRVTPPGEFTEHEAVMIAAGWIITDPDGEGLAAARRQMGEDVARQAQELIRHDPEYVRAELEAIASQARRPGRVRPEPDDDDEGEADNDEDDIEAGP